MHDRTLHDFLGMLSFVVPVLILCVFKWRAWSILLGAIAYWGLTVYMLEVRSRFDRSGGAAGMLVTLGGPVGAFYTGMFWVVGIVLKDCFRLWQRGVKSYRRHADAGLGSLQCLAQVWRDLNKREQVKQLEKQNEELDRPKG